MTILVKNLPFNNVVAAGVATASLRNVLGMTVDRIVLTLGGTALTKAMLTAIKLKANGKVIWDTTGARTDVRNKYRGVFDDATHLTLDFTEPRARTIVGQKLGSIDTTRGILDLTLEVTIAGATAPTLESHSILDAPQTGSNAAGIMAKVLTYTFNSSAAGKINVPAFPFGQQGSIIKRAHFFHGGNMSELEVKQNGVIIYEASQVLNNFIGQEFKKVPQANVYHLDFIVDDNQSNALDTRLARTLEFNPTFTAADALNIEVEFLDALGNL